MKPLLLAMAILWSVNLVAQEKKSSLRELVNLMTGSFDSEKQSIEDSSFYNISLHMYQIWPEEKGHWLYVEQALASRQERPYRQRIYRVEQLDEGRFASHVYNLPNDSLYIGKWKEPEFFDRIGPQHLIPREGCTVFLEQKDKNLYSGSTHETDCKSSLYGASYATSKVTVSKDRIESWDQGFDSEGNQVWGAEKGGYVFLKIQQ